MAVISVYLNEKISDILVEPQNEEFLTSREQPISASVEWMDKGFSKEEFLQDLSQTKMLGGYNAPTYEELSEESPWLFPSLNDFLYMISSLDNYGFEMEDIPAQNPAIEIKSNLIPRL